MLQKSNASKFLLPITLLSVLAACFFAYKYYNKTNAGLIVSPPDQSRCSSCMVYNNTSATNSKLDMNLLKTMAFNYQNPIPVTETRSVWFNLETLKKFIYNIESQSCTCSGNLGVRIYYARYPSMTSVFSSSLTGLPNTYSGIHTLFMVPTIDQPDGYHYDFDPADVSSRCGPYGDKYSKMSYDTLPIPTYTLAPYGTSVTALMAQNHGDACPPVTPPAIRCPDAGAYFNK